MIKTTAMLLHELKAFSSPKDKITRLVQQSSLIPIVNGLYETDRSTSPHLLAGSIYGPSYISFEFALAYHNLIPEAVYTITCATFEKKKKKTYNTPFGTFIYRDVPSDVFYYGLQIIDEKEYSATIAIPEKALCDQLYKIKPIKNLKELEHVLFDDLRISETDLRNLNKDSIATVYYKYRSTNVKKLHSFLRKLS